MSFFKRFLGADPKSEEENPPKMHIESPHEETEGHHEERQSLWKLLSSKIGMDVVVGISLPVTYFEPLTVLQRQAEMLDFAELLNKVMKRNKRNQFFHLSCILGC